MGFRLRRKHMIDLLFPVALFFVFALSAVTLILLAAGIYRAATENSSLQYTSRTGLAYISEKIHQCDENGGIYLGTLDGCEALILEQQYGEDMYRTYIYAWEESLRELFIRDGVEAEAENGRTILEVRDFTVEQLTDRVFRFTCTDREERTSTAVIGMRSGY